MIFTETGKDGGWWRIWEPRTDENGSNVGVQISYDRKIILFEDKNEPSLERIRTPAPRWWWLV